MAAEQDGRTGEPSARNQIRGIVTRVVRDTVMASVEMRAGQHRIVSVMSREEADGVQPGTLAIATVRATDVVVGIPEGAERPLA